MRIYVLLGQYGYLFSGGMAAFANRLRQEFPEARVDVFYWDSWQQVVADMKHYSPPIVIIGYSLGANAISWIARSTGQEVDLAVAYDASVNSETWNPIGEHFKKVLCYRNTLPDLFGQDELKGPTVELVDVQIPHLWIQSSETLHQRTISEIRALQ